MKGGVHAVAFDMVKGASMGLGVSPRARMYEQFRETGKFVGGDGYYCCFEHPDVGLRGGLEIVYPLQVQGHDLTHTDDYTLLIQHCLSQLKLHCDTDGNMYPGYNTGLDTDTDTGSGTGTVDLSGIQLVLGYKMLYDDHSIANMLNLLFESCEATKVCLLSENSLAMAHAATMLREYHTGTDTGTDSNSAMELKSSILIDIGAYCTRIYPIFDGMVLRNAVQVLPVGGEHCTDFMEILLDTTCSRGETQYAGYSSQLPRRRRLIARDIKHRCGLIAPDFDKYMELYGSMDVQVGVAVLPGTGSESTTTTTTDSTTQKSFNQDINKEVSFNTRGMGGSGSGSDGSDSDSELSLTVGCERFYCMEVLFQPDLMAETIKTKSNAPNSSNNGHTTGNGTDSNGNGSGTICPNELNESNCNIDNLKHNNGMISKIVACLQCIDDKTVCEELLEHICICGGSANVPGLVERLTEDLTTPLSDLDLSINTVHIHVLDTTIQNIQNNQDNQDNDGEYENKSHCHMVGAGIRLKHALVSSNTHEPISSTPLPLEITNIILDCDVENIGTNTISQLLTC